MKNRVCDLCKSEINLKDGVSFCLYDLCNACIKLVRCAICRKCEGTKKVRVRDQAATDAQATCGENRTEYKTISCVDCV